MFVPEQTTDAALARLDRILQDTGARRIVFLGDFLHAREGRADETFRVLAEWRARHAGVAMRLVRGNHDRRAGDPPGDVGIECVDGPVLEAPFALAHHPTAVRDAYVVAGHVHPCAVLVGRGRQRERLPCFWEARHALVLPAFGDFTGCAEVTPEPGDELWVVAGEEVMGVS